MPNEQPEQDGEPKNKLSAEQEYELRRRELDLKEMELKIKSEAIHMEHSHRSFMSKLYSVVAAAAIGIAGYTSFEAVHHHHDDEPADGTHVEQVDNSPRPGQTNIVLIPPR